ncbi:hypothetical protein RND71_031220 [Anisodus tanguticus]|uniref:Uncharacterized protein n=1 Tax=Anisodus tanguticus TaxID=243964 RepID=A0AAE1RB93_9SOLA|nr:hypothetical protein RND71_031220 [Anisodus tanguticus]
MDIDYKSKIDYNTNCHIVNDFNGSIDEPLEDGDTALHIASLYGHLSCVENPKELVEPESEAYRILDESICAELGRPYKGRSS